MAFPRKYDPEIKKSEEGSRLYDYWRKIKSKSDHPVFLDYPSFYKWSMENGYKHNATLNRKDCTLPFSPDNCFWKIRAENPDDNKYVDREWEQKWDVTVNRIRVHFGLEPIHSREV